MMYAVVALSLALVGVALTALHLSNEYRAWQVKAGEWQTRAREAESELVLDRANTKDSSSRFDSLLAYYKQRLDDCEAALEKLETPESRRARLAEFGTGPMRVVSAPKSGDGDR